jgi:hypothetical protein
MQGIQVCVRLVIRSHITLWYMRGNLSNHVGDPFYSGGTHPPQATWYVAQCGGEAPMANEIRHI